jgi:hypothetical protein
MDKKRTTKPCNCFICLDKIKIGAERVITENGMDLCLLCDKAWETEQVPLARISRSKVKDGYRVVA